MKSSSFPTTVSSSRDSSLDIMKGILILLVVFGHLIEKSSQPIISSLYGMIYLFHMPAFVFLAGWFSPQQQNKQKLRVVVLAKTYLIWTLIYGIVFFALTGKLLSPFTPYWILWFIFSLLIWTGTIFFLEKIKPVWIFLTILAGAIMAGLINGMEFGIQKTLYFFPFFYAGFFLRKTGVDPKNTKKTVLLGGIAIATILLVSYFLNPSLYPYELLYGSQSFESLGLPPFKGMTLRLGMIAGGFGWIILLFTISKHISFKYFETIGRNSLTIYLLHGIVVLGLRETGEMEFTTLSPLIFVVPFTALLCFLLGNDWLSDKLKNLGLIYKTSHNQSRT